jgi:hypothetical protein
MNQNNGVLFLQNCDQLLLLNLLRSQDYITKDSYTRIYSKLKSNVHCATDPRVNDGHFHC